MAIARNALRLPKGQLDAIAFIRDSRFLGQIFLKTTAPQYAEKNREVLMGS